MYDCGNLRIVWKNVRKIRMSEKQLELKEWMRIGCMTVLSPPTPPTLPQHKHRHTSNTPPVSTGLVTPRTNNLIHSPLSPPTPPRAKHIHISHTPPTPPILCTTLIQITSAALDTIPEPRVPPTCPDLHSPQPHLINSPHQHGHHPRTLTLFHHIHMQHKQQYTHHSHNNHCIHIGYHDNLTDRPKTTT